MKYFNKLYSCVPTIIEEYSNQKELSEVNEDEFKKDYLPQPQPWYQILYKVICFFVFLGPLRIVFCFGGAIVLLGISVIFRMWLFKTNPPYSYDQDNFTKQSQYFRDSISCILFYLWTLLQVFAFNKSPCRNFSKNCQR